MFFIVDICQIGHLYLAPACHFGVCGILTAKPKMQTLFDNFGALSA